MFVTRSMSCAPTAAAGEPVAKKSKSQDVSRRIDNMDYRVRLEGALLLGREDPWSVGANHNKKAILMAALLNWTAMEVSSCPRGTRGGYSSEPAISVRNTAVGELSQKTRGPRVCLPAKAESVRP